MARWSTIRKMAAVGVSLAALDGLLAGNARLTGLADPDGPAGLSVLHLVHLLVVLALVTLLPGLWRGTRTALWLTIGALLALSALEIASHLAYAAAAVPAVVALLLLASHAGFRLGSRNRPRLRLAGAGAVAWLLVYGALVAGRVDAHRHHVIRRVLHHALDFALRALPTRPESWWVLIAEGCLALALALSLLALRSVVRPAGGGAGHTPDEHQRARAIAQRWGTDSLSPFIMRPDKAYHFAADSVLAYRLVGDTAVISGDPVGPAGSAAAVVESFRSHARARGWRIAIWGASSRNLEHYRTIGLRTLRAGEEAFVAPASFTLEGRPVRKLRQSVHRVARRGWVIEISDGRDVCEQLEDEIDVLEQRWRDDRRRVLGFSMGMGVFKPEVRPDDLYVLARSPEGELRAMMRFFWHSGRLSLDAMRRVGESPNGLNEALVARALQAAAERDIREVSLNYAGLAHLVRGAQRRGPVRRRLAALLVNALHGRFQLERLVRFNEKFAPEWRPRFLVYESPAALPRTLVRVLQAEGYLPMPGGRPPARRRRRLRHAPRTSAAANARS